jgi:hypothetical protein
VFGLVHVAGTAYPGALLLQIPLAFVGVGLAWAFERRGLVGSVGAHMAFNAIGIVALLTIR